MENKKRKELFLKPEEKAELEHLLTMPCEELEQKIGGQWYRQRFADLLQVGSHTTLMLLEQGIHLIDPGWDRLESVSRVIYTVRTRKLPLRAIFLTHAHIDHYYNLKYYHYLAEIQPQDFSFVLLSHDMNAGFAHKGNFLGFCQDEEFLKLDGGKYFLLKTPGHSRENDHFAVFEPVRRLLLVGDLLQPQGESYEYCTFLTPVSNHYNPEEVYQSILLLKSLPFEYVLSGHGEFMDMSRGYRWMEITQKTIERTSYYCRRALWSEENNGNFIETAKKVYFQIAMERNMPLDPLVKRMENMQNSQVKDHETEGEHTDFELFDLPTIAWFLRKFGM
jgi:glyoxylase-like metal-dependent hydrolase (beta-lactamase superfamily II)